MFIDDDMRDKLVLFLTCAIVIAGIVLSFVFHTKIFGLCAALFCAMTSLIISINNR